MSFEAFEGVGFLLPPEEAAWAQKLKELFQYTPETRENSLIVDEEWQPDIKRAGKARV